jgi:hypothetical protein
LDHLGSGEVDEFIVELGQLRDPPSLAIVEFLRFSEIQEIEVIGINLNLMWGSVEVVSPFPKGTNNTEEFSVINFVSSFGGVKGFQKEKDWMASSSRVHLRKDRS